MADDIRSKANRERIARLVGRPGLRSSIFALYFLASAIGFFYVDAYYSYEEIDIDILSHVESLDLLFISIEHIDKVLFVALGGLVAVLLSLVVAAFVAVLITAGTGYSLCIRQPFSLGLLFATASVGYARPSPTCGETASSDSARPKSQLALRAQAPEKRTLKKALFLV